MIVDKKDLKIGHWYQLSISHKDAYYNTRALKRAAITLIMIIVIMP